MTEQRIKEICRLLVAFIIVASSLLIIFAVYNQLQRLVFGSSDDFLFEGSKFIGPILITYGIIMIVSIAAVLGYGDRMGMVIGYYDKVNIRLVFSGITIVFIGTLICLFFNYGRINANGIVYQENVFKEKVSYTWNDVENVSVCPASKIKSRSKSRTTY